MIDIDVLTPDEKPADIFVGCVGYEKRSIHHLGKLSSPQSSSIILFDYRAENLFSYSRNIKLAAEKNARLHSSIGTLVDDVLTSASTSPDAASIEIDITSLDRGKLAYLFAALFKHSKKFATVRLVYYPRTYTQPKYTFEIVNSFGPVIPEMMGNAALSRDELTVIVGAGYEYGRVVGALDTLEPGRVICFAPKGTDSRYDQAVVRANLEFSFLGKEEALIWYALPDTFALYYNLRRIVELEASTGNVLILPLGPKLFAAISMVIALALHPRISVWRHSTTTTARPDSLSDAVATGEKLSFMFRFQPS